MKKSSIAIIGLFFLLYILPLGVQPIIIPDETRYAEIPREMLVSGDWVVPHLNGLRYFEKPVLGYWVNAASIMLFGENAFAIRLPSALAAGISALMLLLMVRRFAAGYAAGILAAAAFLTCFEVFGIGTFNVLDSVFSMFVTAGMVSFFFAHMEGKPVRRTGFLFLFGAFCGLGFFTKGFIAFAIPVLSIVPFMIWEGRWRELFRIPWLPLVAALLVALPWAVMIYTREPDFWHYFFWIEHIKRFMSHNAQHPEAFWYFVPVLIGGALPWTVLLPSVVQGINKTLLKDPLARFGICWFIFPFLFFSASHGKLVTYILPCFPPLAILMAIGLHHYFKQGRKRAFNSGALFLVLVIIILAVALVVVEITGFLGFRPYVQIWKCVLVVSGILFWASLLVFSIRESGYRKKIVLYAAAPIVFMFITHFIMPDLTIDHKAPGEFLLSHSHRIRPDTILVSGEEPVRAVCWVYRRSDVYLLEGAGELHYGVHFEDSRHRLLNLDQLRELIIKNRGTGRVTLIAKSGKYENWKQDLPEPVFADINGSRSFVFVQF